MLTIFECIACNIVQLWYLCTYNVYLVLNQCRGQEFQEELIAEGYPSLRIHLCSCLEGNMVGALSHRLL